MRPREVREDQFLDVHDDEAGSSYHLHLRDGELDTMRASQGTKNFMTYATPT